MNAKQRIPAPRGGQPWGLSPQRHSLRVTIVARTAQKRDDAPTGSGIWRMSDKGVVGQSRNKLM